MSRSDPPRSGEFFAPLPLAAVLLMVVNDVWLKPAFHSELTGKLSDIALCFFMPLFVSELIGLASGCAVKLRLALGAVATAGLYVALEICAPFTRLVLDGLTWIGPSLGIRHPFRMTSDPTDLWCVALIPLAIVYGERRLARARAQAAPNGSRRRGKDRVAVADRAVRERGSGSVAV